MTVEKAKIKVGTLNALGVKLDDALEAANRQKFASEGSMSALRIAAKKLLSLHAHVDQDLEEGKLPEGDALPIASYAKQYITRCINSLENMAVAADIQTQQVTGRVEGLKHAITVTKKDVDAEVNKITAAAEALNTGVMEIEADRPAGRLTGTHPGNAAADRKAETIINDLPNMKRKDLIKLAEDRGITIDKRWKQKRLAETIDKALQNGAHA